MITTKQPWSAWRNPVSFIDRMNIQLPCMLRVLRRSACCAHFTPPIVNFDEKHDIVSLFKSSDSAKLNERARTRLRDPIQTVHLLWQNRFRFFSESRLRAHIRALGQDKRAVFRGADFLKVRCKELQDACDEIITVGMS